MKFQTLTEAGEDTIYLDEKKQIAVNKEVFTDEVLKDLGLNKKDLEEKKAIEVGNIFSLGTKFSAPFDLKYKNEKGEDKLVIMGCYGIGIGRLMGTIVEVLSDNNGIVWPTAVAPFKVHLVEIVSKNSKVKEKAEEIYNKLTDSGVEVLYDDREARAGEKFADSDLIGIPLRIVVSEKSLDGEFEIKERKNGKVEMIKEKEILKFVENHD
jgi:prolyl-tRNA synthetase